MFPKPIRALIRVLLSSADSDGAIPLSGYSPLTGYNYMIDKLEDYRYLYYNISNIINAANATKEKLKVYYSETGSEVYAVAIIMDPCLKAWLLLWTLMRGRID